MTPAFLHRADAVILWTGSTMRAAIAALHTQEIEKLIVAVPVAAAQTCAELRREIDERFVSIQPMEEDCGSGGGGGLAGRLPRQPLGAGSRRKASPAASERKRRKS